MGRRNVVIVFSCVLLLLSFAIFLLLPCFSRNLGFNGLGCCWNVVFLGCEKPLFTFTVIGDSRVGVFTEYLRSVCGFLRPLVSNDYVQLVVFVGDIVDVGNRKYFKLVREIMGYRSVLWNRTLFAIGNHDWGGNSEYRELFVKFFELPSTNYSVVWKFKGLDGNTYRMLFIVLTANCTKIGSGYDIVLEELEWMDRVLEEHRDLNAFIVIHYPLPSIKHSETFLQHLRKHRNVVAVLSGHGHGGGCLWFTAEDGHVFVNKWVRSILPNKRGDAGYIWFVDVYYDRIETYGFSPVKTKCYCEAQDRISIPLPIPLKK